jgi:Ca2+-binding RTX toxin-like protein
MHDPHASAASRRQSDIANMVEALEERRLLSGATLSGGVLDITGSRLSDRITIERNASGGSYVVTVRGQSFVFAADKVKQINIVCGRGNDLVAISNTNGGVGPRRAVDGGDGDDTLVGGKGQDSLLGRDGDDRMDGREGEDTCIGGADDDTIFGGLSNDSLAGNTGDDDIEGGFGDDSITGGPGNDTCHGGPDSDSVFGNDGNDSVDGDDGVDEVHGGRGTDVFDDTNDDENERVDDNDLLPMNPVP